MNLNQYRSQKHLEELESLLKVAPKGSQMRKTLLKMRRETKGILASQREQLRKEAEG